MTQPTTMHAAVQVATRLPLELHALPVPELRPGHVLVQVAAAGLNPLDTKIRAGVADHARQPLPAVLGIDLAGIVVAGADDVTTFRTGDAVFGMTGGVGGVQGALAQYAVVDAALLARKPEALSMREAAAVPLTFITAWEGLMDRARVAAGHQVLIQGGAGGIGQMAIQIARSTGAQVFATGLAEQGQLIRDKGATFIDFQSVTPEEYVATHTNGAGFDVVFDTVGGTTLDQSFTIVKRHTGHVVSALGWGTHSIAPLSFRGATYSGIFTLLPLITGDGRTHHGWIVQQAAAMADRKHLQVNLDPQEFALREVEAAFRKLESGAARGKVVVSI